MKLDVGAFEDSFKGKDIVFYSETHQAPGSSLPKVSGYLWESACRQEVRSEGRNRGSGGVAVLFKEELRPLIHIVRKDNQARYMWVRITSETGKPLYIAICYFPPSTSNYAPPKGHSPFTVLNEDIWEFSRSGEVMLVGDFNARTGTSQSTFFDSSEEMLREVDTEDLELTRHSIDKECTSYGKYLMDLGTIHGMAILNGLLRFPSSFGFTCYPHRHGASIVDYILAQPSFLPSVNDLSIGPRPFGVAVDHALLTLTISFQFNTTQKMQLPKQIRYTFTPDCNPAYKDGLYRRLADKNPQSPLSKLTEDLTKAIHEAAQEAYPHTKPHQKRSTGNMPQNNWYDEECKEMRTSLQKEELSGAITHKQSKKMYSRIVRRKKRNYLAQLEKELYHLFLSQDSAEAWKFFQERTPPPAITSTEVWGEYAKTLYTVLGQEPLPEPLEICPQNYSFFTKEMVRKAIDKMKTKRAYDHEGLVAEHFINAKDIITGLITVMFNRALNEGFPDTWSLSTIIPIFKSGDPMIPGNYRTIMIGHTLAKLYASILEQQLSRWAEKSGKRATGQAGFRKGFSTIDHIFTLRAIIEEGRAEGRKIYCTFVDFRKAFDTIPRAQMILRLEEMGVPMELIWGILALYESVKGQIRTKEGVSEIIQSTIGVKQGCPLSPTLFGLYIDEMAEYLEKKGGKGAQLGGTQIPLLLYADDIVLISDSPEEMQKHLNILRIFALDSGMSVNLGKTKTMIFNSTPQWVRRSAPTFNYGESMVEYTDNYTYLGVVFSGPVLSFKDAAKTRLTRAVTAMGRMEKWCSQIQFQEPRTKLWLFDTLVTSVMLYGVQAWGPSVDPANKSDNSEQWKNMERPLISMISRMIGAKSSVPHDIIRAEIAAPKIVTEALAKSINFLQNTWKLPRYRYTRLALESSRQLALKGDQKCWYAQLTAWLCLHGVDIERLPPFQYSLDAPSLTLSKQEINKLIKQDLTQLDTKRTWMEPIGELGTKKKFYKEHFLLLSNDGFITRAAYMDIHLSYNVRSAIGQIRTSSHNLEIETGRFRGIQGEERICQLCRIEPETEEHHVCCCPVYYEIRGRFHCLFREGFGPLSRVMNYIDQRCLGLFLLEIRRLREGLLKKSHYKSNTQKEITNFFKTQTKHPNKEDPAQIPNLRSSAKGILLDRAVDIWKSKRLKTQKTTRYRQRIHQKIRIILSQQKRRPIKTLSLEEVEKLRHQPMLDLLGPSMSRRQL